MTMYARLAESGLVLETCEQDPELVFHPEIAKEFKEVPDGAEAGDTVAAGRVVKAELPAEPPTPDPVETRHAPRGEFLAALTRGERLALAKLAQGDEEVADFLSMIDSLGYLDLGNQEDVDLLDQLQKKGVLSKDSVTTITQLR